MNQPFRKNKNLFFWPLIIIFAALLIRLISLHQMQQSPFFDSPVLLSESHDTRAVEILNGDFLGKSVFFHDPLYEYFLAGVYAAVGINYFYVKLIHAFLGVLSSVLIYIIGKKLFSRSTGIIASFIYIFYAPAIILETELLNSSLAIILNLLLIFMLTCFYEKNNYLYLFCSGVILSLCSINRSEVLILLPMIILWSSIVLWNKGYKKILLYQFVFFIGISIFIVPVATRNYIVGKDFVLISYKGGSNLYTGNNPDADGLTAEIAGTDITSANEQYETLPHQIAEKRLGRTLLPSESSNYWIKETMRSIMENPRSSLFLFFKKGYFFWQGFEIPNNVNFYYLRQYSGVLKVLLWKAGVAFPFGILGPMALLGMIFAIKDIKRIFPLYASVGLYFLVTVIAFAAGRFRIPAIPPLAIFAGVGINQILLCIKQREHKKIGKYLSSLAVLIVVLNIDFYGLNKRNQMSYSTSNFNAGYAFEKKSMVEQAQTMYENSLEIMPNHGASINLGLIHLRKEQLPEAIENFQRAITTRPASPNAYIMLGNAYMKLKLWNKAISAIIKGIELKPQTSFIEKMAHSDLIHAYYETGDTGMAISAAKGMLEIFPGDIETHSTLAFLHVSSNQIKLGINEYKTILKLDKDNKTAHYNIAKAFEITGNTLDALSHYRTFTDLAGAADNSLKKEAERMIEFLAPQRRP